MDRALLLFWNKRFKSWCPFDISILSIDIKLNNFGYISQVDHSHTTNREITCNNGLKILTVSWTS